MNFKLQIANFRLLLIAFVAVAMTSCDMFNKKDQPELFKLTDLQHLWLENGDTTEGHFVRFTTENSDETGYLYGREWTTSDDKHEQDLIDAREKLGHPGNGWFKYQFSLTDGGLIEVHLMDNGGAEIPKSYIVSKLTETDLEYYEKDNKDWKYAFTRVVELQSAD